MPHVLVNDISMYYEKHGSGEPLICIAGFGADHSVWYEVLPHLCAHFQVVLFDNRGAGQTAVPEGPYSIEQMAKDTIGLCEQLNIQQAHFIGNSMGGCIVQTLAFLDPELVHSMVLSNTTPYMDTPFRFYVEAQLELMKAKADPAFLMKALCSWLFSSKFLSQEGMLEQLIELGLANPYPFTRSGYEGQLEALRKFDSRSWLHALRVPTLVLSSDEDLVFNRRQVDILSQEIEGARSHCFEGCGHLPQLECPERFARVVKQFMEFERELKG